MAVFPVILDSCVLYPMYLRDTLLRAAEVNLYRAHWSSEILDGTFRNLIINKQLTSEKAEIVCKIMNLSFPEAIVDVPESLLPCMDNDEGDRHVLAAALTAKAQVIVTDNLKHFTLDSLSKFQIEAQSADQFLTHLYDLFPEMMRIVIEQQASDLKRPKLSVSELLTLLQKNVPIFTSRVS